MSNIAKIVKSIKNYTNTIGIAIVIIIFFIVPPKVEQQFKVILQKVEVVSDNYVYRNKLYRATATRQMQICPP